MKIVTYQDRTAWLQWRHGGLGSSDAASIMGVSRFKSKEELFREKVQGFRGEDQANEYIKQRGNRIEPLVRTEMEKRYSKSFNSLNVIHPSFEFMRCSLDGCSEDNKTLIEIKLLSSVTPGKVNKEAAGYKKWVAAIEGVVPEDYLPQILHQLLVTGANECLFVGYKEIRHLEPKMEDSLAIVNIRAEDYINDIKHLAKQEFEFWYEVQEAKRKLNYSGELE